MTGIAAQLENAVAKNIEPSTAAAAQNLGLLSSAITKLGDTGRDAAAVLRAPEAATKINADGNPWREKPKGWLAEFVHDFTIENDVDSGNPLVKRLPAVGKPAFALSSPGEAMTTAPIEQVAPGVPTGGGGASGGAAALGTQVG